MLGAFAATEELTATAADFGEADGDSILIEETTGAGFCGCFVGGCGDCGICAGEGKGD